MHGEEYNMHDEQYKIHHEEYRLLVVYWPVRVVLHLRLRLLLLRAYLQIDRAGVLVRGFALVLSGKEYKATEVAEQFAGGQVTVGGLEGTEDHG